MNDFLREALKSYPNLTEEMLRLVPVHPGPLILPELGDKLGAYAQRKLGARGVEIRINTKVLSVSGPLIQLSDGSSVMADTLVWTAGSSPNPLIASIACEKMGGRVCVNENLEVAGWPGVGRCAIVRWYRTQSAEVSVHLPRSMRCVKEKWSRTISRPV